MKTQNQNLTSLVESVRDSLESASDESELRHVALQWSTLADWAERTKRESLFQCADLFSELFERAADSSAGPEANCSSELVEFSCEHVSLFEQEDFESEHAARILEQLESFATELSFDEDMVAEPWDELEPGDQDEATESPFSQSDEQVRLLLSALTPQQNNLLEDGLSEQESSDESKTMADAGDTSSDADVDNSGKADSEMEARRELAMDEEMLAAYLDDAMRCLTSMEQAALALEESPNDKSSIEQFCRELHTLKGASAMVGLSDLASHMHELESDLQANFVDGGTVETERLFETVDRVRNEITVIGSLPAESPGHADEEKQTGALAPASATSSRSELSRFSNDGSSIRIRASKLDRLMDMLAELVVLRNRRDSYAAEFNQLNDELVKCSLRLSCFADHEPEWTNSSSSQHDLISSKSGASLTEVATDIEAVSQSMRTLFKPVSEDNGAITRFIRDFRQELMQLRRIPVQGLFNRLQRAARDAAKSESKKVRIEITGEQTGLEQEIQEKLFEPLLHIVRNSVSHGIESQDTRSKSGKNSVGLITLSASSSAQLLVIEVQDDGGGVDYSAIRSRAIEKGLISSNSIPSNRELSQLIFHPGFSTRKQATEVSGRGVGMDVVATTIEQLRGRIEIDSEAGQGTTIRLLVPLRTGIEHVMSFRSGGQLFALPLQSVTAAKSSNANIENIVHLNLPTSQPSKFDQHSQCDDVLILQTTAAQNSGKSKQIAISVDQLIGPEEVVVRGLPNLLKPHPLFCGMTLSGSGETVLLLNGDRVLEFCHDQSSNVELDDMAEADGGPTYGKRALVVDDSLTARRVVSKQLQQLGFATVEAGDGIEAIERLLKEDFDLVTTDLDMPRFGGLELLTDIRGGWLLRCSGDCHQ